MSERFWFSLHLFCINMPINDWFSCLYFIFYIFFSISLTSKNLIKLMKKKDSSSLTSHHCFHGTSWQILLLRVVYDTASIYDHSQEKWPLLHLLSWFLLLHCQKFSQFHMAQANVFEIYLESIWTLNQTREPSHLLWNSFPWCTCHAI